MARIKLDVSHRSVVAVCPCGWRCIRVAVIDAESAALDHARRGHPDDTDIRNTLDVRASRR